jgi:hypothetical protein
MGRSRREVTLQDLGLQGEETADQRQGRKYGNVITVVDGIKFKSRFEAGRYSELRLMEQAGEIKNLKLHTRWVLLPAFVDNTGKKQRAVEYEDDFSYQLADGAVVVEDTKGFATEAYLIKRKMFLYTYPYVRFREVRLDGKRRR